MCPVRCVTYVPDRATLFACSRVLRARDVLGFEAVGQGQSISGTRWWLHTERAPNSTQED
jgi:hypothetical protein